MGWAQKHISLVVAVIAVAAAFDVACTAALAQVSESGFEKRNYGTSVDPYKNLEGYRPPPSPFGGPCDRFKYNRTTNPNEIDALRRNAYTRYTQHTNQRGPHDAATVQSLTEYQCYEERLQALRRTTPFVDERSRFYPEPPPRVRP